MSTDPALLDRLHVPKRKRHWPHPLRAMRALRRLLADPDDTQKALDVSYALDGDWSERQLCEMVRNREGRRVFASRPDLLAILSDDDALAAMPEGSFGHGYRDHMTRWGLDPAKLLEMYRKTDPRNAHRDDAQIWLAERENLEHDLSHVLSGYGADGLGEAALLWFTAGQQARPSRIFLAIGASLRIASEFGIQWLPYAWKAWQRGRRATNLLPLPYEELLPLPLADVRRALGIEDPKQAHPGGVRQMPAATAASTASSRPAPSSLGLAARGRPRRP